jgi:hypothetical protein
MFKKIWLFIIVLSFTNVLYSQEFKTEFNVWNSGLYVKGNSMPVEVRIRITLDNNAPASPDRHIVYDNITYATNNNYLFVTGSLKAKDIVKFVVTDANGNSIGQRPYPRTDPNFFESRMHGNDNVGNVVHLFDWFELDKEGLYFVGAQWQFSTDNGKTYTGQTDKKPFRIISKQGDEIYGLIGQITQRRAQMVTDPWPFYNLVSIGESAIDYILLWCQDVRDNMPWIQQAQSSLYESRSVLALVSQIGSEQGRKIIAEANNIDDAERQSYLERIDIWQSPDRYKKLVARLSTPDAKWAIYKLGILGDNRAIPVLEQVAQQHENLDTRETAKDALAHLKDLSVPMYYRQHYPSERIALSSPKTTYKLGEPVKINCKLIAGPYGSRSLVQFSKPAYHFLPWGIGSEPYRVQIRFDIRGDSFGKEMPKMMLGMGGRMPGMPPMDEAALSGGMPSLIPKKVPPPPGVNEYGGVAPIKELQSAQQYLANQKQEPLEGYLSADFLGAREPLNLGPNETREYTLSNLNECFHLNTPGQYKIYVGVPLFKTGIPSNEIIIKISDPNSK